MGAGLLATVFGSELADERGVERFYECTACGSTFEAWPTACSDCGQLYCRT